MRTLPQTINVCSTVNGNVFRFAAIFHNAAKRLSGEDVSEPVLLIGALTDIPRMTDSPYLREYAEAAIHHLKIEIGAVADL